MLTKSYVRVSTFKLNYFVLINIQYFLTYFGEEVVNNCVSAAAVLAVSAAAVLAVSAAAVLAVSAAAVLAVRVHNYSGMF